MGIVKEVKDCPFDNEDPQTREEEIAYALAAVPKLSPDELATFAISMNYAAANGMLPQLTSQELAALRTISQKCIPDAPKQINLNASIKTEEVILGWLNVNEENLDKTKARVLEQTVLELEHLDNLEDFSQNFTTTGEEDG